MRNKLLLFGAVAAVAVTLMIVGDRFLERRTVKIDDTVTLVTLDEIVIVMQRGEPPRVTRVRPDVTLPRDIRITPPPAKGRPDAPKPAVIRWTLPYSCSDVRYYSSHFTPAQLDALRRAAGMALPTAEQRQQIQACLAGRIK